MTEPAKTCQEFITATGRCGKPAVITALIGLSRDLCAECAMRITLRTAPARRAERS
jgi:hypothetical protein